MATYNYDKDTDYSTLIQEAAANKQWQQAAQYEQQRNAKIQGEGMDYALTNDYVGNLDSKDYSQQIQQGMKSGASAADIQGLLDSRTNKANSAVNLNQYAYDDIFGAATEYIKRKSMDELTYENAPEYLSTYQSAIDAMLADIQGNTYQKFLTTDQYGALEGQYTRLGQRAMQDTLGDVSARTGGLASSYAVTAGQQAYGNQMTALEQAALDMWNTDRANQRSDMNMLMGLESMDYGKYRDSVGDWKDNRNFGYGVTQDNKMWDYQLSQDERAQQEWLAAELAKQGDYSGYLALGYNEEQAKTAFALWQAQNPQLAAALYGGVGYSGGSGGSGAKKSATQEDTIVSYDQARGLVHQTMYDYNYNKAQMGQYLKQMLSGGSITQEDYKKLTGALNSVRA